MPTWVTIDSARRELAKRFAAAGLESPLLDARLIMSAVLDLDLTGLATQAQRPLMAEEMAAIEGAASRRLQGEPIARILGAKEFWGLPFALSAETLIPRPDTETLVEAVLSLCADREAPWRIADLGTGCGAILLALLSELPHATGVATDISVAALRTAAGNAARFGLADRVSFVACDYASALRGPFGFIVSNPPYVRSAEVGELAVEVRDHDPSRALDGGPDGLDAYRAIAKTASGLLAPQGCLAVEIGSDQASAVIQLMTDAGLEPEPLPRLDLARLPRVVIGRGKHQENGLIGAKRLKKALG